MKVSGPGEWTESCGATVPPCTELRVPSYLPVSSCWLQLPASRKQINQRCQITLQIIWSHAGRHKLTQFMQKVCSQSIFWIKAFLWESCFNLQKVAFCRQMVCWMKFRLRPNFVQGCPFFSCSSSLRGQNICYYMLFLDGVCWVILTQIFGHQWCNSAFVHCGALLLKNTLTLARGSTK